MGKTCQLIIEDEVNVKFDSLDPSVRRKIVNSLKIFIPYARHTPSFKLGRWDGTKSFATTGGRTALHLLDKVLPIIEEAGYDIEVVDKRVPISITFPEIKADMFSSITWPKGHPLEGEPIVLRDHQVDAITRFTNNLQCVQEIATSAGKTIVTAALSKLCEPYGRTIIVVPNRDLVTQTEADYKNLQLDVGVFYGGRNEWNKTHTICTWQSLAALDRKAKNRLTDEQLHEFLDGVTCVIVDECLDGNTLVKTPLGNEPIKNLKQGDVVISFNLETKEFEEDVVVKVHKNMINSFSEKMYRLEFDNGIVLNVTGNHKLLTENRGYVRADEITNDDILISWDK